MKSVLVILVLLLAVAPSLPAQNWVSWNDDFDRDEWDNGYFDDLRGWADDWFGGSNRQPGGDPGYGNNVSGRAQQLVGEVRQDRRPWSGDWWRRKTCDLAFKNTGGGLSPFEKYDSIVLNFYGRIPGASAWEADPSHQHNDGPNGGASWAGHCNGLAAASILTREPRRNIRIPLDKQVVAKLTWPNARSCRPGLFRDGQFDYKYYRASQLDLTVDDMKGWLSEVYMNCQTQQVGSAGSILGQRYNGSTINYNDPAFQDIHPHNYHYLLDQFIRQRQQSFVAEVDPHAPVNNHPVYKFECQMKPGPGYTHCTTKVYHTDYATRSNFVGTNTMTRTYQYALVTDGSGRITRGQWLGGSVSRHPDFIWIPIADRAAYGNYENPCLKTDFIAWLFQRHGAY